MEAREFEARLCPSYEAFEIALVNAANGVLWNWLEDPKLEMWGERTMSALEQSYLVK